MVAAVDQTADWGVQQIWSWRGYRCHWRVTGPAGAPPLLLLHGFGASSSHWRRTAPRLAEGGWRVYSLDLLGFGASEQPARPLSNGLWGYQVCAFLRQVVQQPAVLIGNSLGGLTALTAAVLQPKWVNAVVAAPLPDPALLNPVPRTMARRKRRWMRRLLWIILRLLPLELLVPLISRTSLLKVGLQAAYFNSVTGDRDLLKLIARPARRPTAARALRGMCFGMALRAQASTAPALLVALQRPLLLIWGREDRFVPLSIGESIHHQHPHIDLVALEGCGHCPHDEVPERFIDVLLPWLDRNLGDIRPAGDNQRR